MNLKPHSQITISLFLSREEIKAQKKHHVLRSGPTQYTKPPTQYATYHFKGGMQTQGTHTHPSHHMSFLPRPLTSPLPYPPFNMRQPFIPPTQYLLPSPLIHPGRQS